MYVPFFICNTPPTCNHHLQLGLCWAITMHKSQGQTLDLSLIHISEPTRLGMISYAVFCLKKKTDRLCLCGCSANLGFSVEKIVLVLA